MVPFGIRDLRFQQLYHYGHRYYQARRRDSDPCNIDNCWDLADLFEDLQTEQEF